MFRTWGDAQRAGWGILSPCWMRYFMYVKAGAIPALRSTDAAKVTCKRCTTALAKIVEGRLSGCTHPNAASHYHTCPDCGEDPFPDQR